jgi:hypothetical protein
MSECVDWLSLSDSSTSVGAELDPSSSWALAPVLREGVPNWASGGIGRARGLGVGYRAGGGTIIWCASPSSKMAKESSLREVVRGLWAPCRRRAHHMVRLAAVENGEEVVPA